jgi:hypothetical protein
VPAWTLLPTTLERSLAVTSPLSWTEGEARTGLSQVDWVNTVGFRPIVAVACVLATAFYLGFFSLLYWTNEGNK